MRFHNGPRLALLLVLAGGSATGCLGALPPTPAGNWTGSCDLTNPVSFTFDLRFLANGEGILSNGSGPWALYEGAGSWGGEQGVTDLAVCNGPHLCELSNQYFHPNDVVVSFGTSTQPGLVGTWDGDSNLSGDCFDGTNQGTFTATK